MIFYKRAVVILFLVGVITTCADNRANRPDEEAMLIYRDCMDHAPKQWDAYDASAALSNKKNKGTASFDVNVKTAHENREQLNCLQQAGWNND